MHIARDGQVVQLRDPRYLPEALLELLDLAHALSAHSPQTSHTHLAVVLAELDDGDRREEALRVRHERVAAQDVHVALEQQQVAARLHGDEARPRDVHAERVVEVLDRRARGCLELII